jgi:hypothetical protein
MEKDGVRLRYVNCERMGWKGNRGGESTGRGERIEIGCTVVI